MSFYPKSIASWFIKKADKEDIFLDQIKLMKLVYIAQGLALAKGKALFAEPIQAWKYGPVIESLYHEFKHLGMQRITSENICSDDLPTDLNENTRDILLATWKNFKNFTGIQLSNWTHNTDSPWYKEWEENDGKSYRNHNMNNETIAAYFKTFIKT